ncbi:MAG: hypothetical protein IKV59_07765 [Lachnospiraceae bacterium]|nr:hypothetical protein [Lachnospiraceae bacterium]
MDTGDKRFLARQMYTNDSEVGRMKLQSVKENLYEATTKVVWYSIEMYTKKELREWVQTDLFQYKDNFNNDLKREAEELKKGHIGSIDITNGCLVINDFIRRNTLQEARNVLNKRIELEEGKLSVLEEKEEVLNTRKQKLEELQKEEHESDSEEMLHEDEEEVENSEHDLRYLEEDIEEEELDEDDDEDEEEEEENAAPSELELFEEQIWKIRNLEELTDLLEELQEDKTAVENKLNELIKLSRRKGGQDLLTTQFKDEETYLNHLRKLRNSAFAHKTEDEFDISQIGSWVPEGGPLYEWAGKILEYIKVIEKRYQYYALFDDYYASREGKAKFDGCKVYVQKQIKELYVNRSSVFFEFAGELYDKDDEEYHFRRLIEHMAVSWDTGIRYLTVVTNEDLPELNVFFKECLSGTNKYVDCYLLDRNALRDACRKKDTQDADYIYFRLLYHLHPAMDKIYWKGRSYTKKEYARQVIYKYIKVKNMFQFDARLKDYEKYLGGIDVKKWCEHHLLSEIFFTGMDDSQGYELAKEMEDAILEFCSHTGKGKHLRFRRAIKASVQLYFYMGEDYVFSYTRSNGQTVHWRSLEDACKYMENGRRFQSYTELYGFVDELYRSDYFKIWRNHLKRIQKEDEVQQ